MKNPGNVDWRMANGESSNRRCHLFLVIALFFNLSLALAHSQLAITEVMSASRVNPITGFRGPEYWELTNYSTNELNLHGYGFRDSKPDRPPVLDAFTNLVLRGGESAVFFRIADAKEVVTNAAQFRAWWGDVQLPANLQFRTWRSPGLSGWDGDAVTVLDPQRRVVDSVSFGRAQLGRAFTYDPESGLFGVFSAPGIDGAITAVKADDVGSPGSTTGLVPLRITRPPSSQTIDVGMNATFSVDASGLPRPAFQWLFNGAPLPGQTGSSLTLTNVQPSEGGAYLVVITNGVESVTSIVANLTVNTSPTPPWIITPPDDAIVFEHQTAVLKAVARGLPTPNYQWQLNGIDLPGAVGSTLAIPDVTLAMSGTSYSVRLWNQLGTTNASASLQVSRRPDLRFTEVMARPADEEGNRHFDWFELTNFDTNAVNLQYWRFADRPSFTEAFTITNALVLLPGESAVFAERLPESVFATWWGADALPVSFKFCTFGGFGLTFSGDQLYLWNPAATDPHDPLASTAWAGSLPGVSIEIQRQCYPEIGCFDEPAGDSVAGVNGAFRAADGPDIGSPGYTANAPLKILSVQRQTNGVTQVKFRTVTGKAYRLWRASGPSASSWESVQTQTAAGNVLTLSDLLPSAGSACFYRVEALP